MCAYTQSHTNAHIYTDTHPHKHIHMHTHTCIRTQTHTQMHIYSYTPTHPCARQTYRHIHIYAGMCRYMHACTHVQEHTCANAQTHTTPNGPPWGADAAAPGEHGDADPTKHAGWAEPGPPQDRGSTSKGWTWPARSPHGASGARASRRRPGTACSASSFTPPAESPLPHPCCQHRGRPGRPRGTLAATPPGSEAKSTAEEQVSWRQPARVKARSAAASMGPGAGHLTPFPSPPL